jgi:hypothetical protein
MTPRSTHPAVETPKHTYGVAAVDVGERALAVAWGRLVSTGHQPVSATSSPSTWTMDLETIAFGLLPTQDYLVRITLKDGRTLAGEAVLESTNGRRYHFESRGEWTDLDEREPARDKR